MESFKKDTEVDVSGDAMVMQRLRDAAEKAKIELSSAHQTDVNLPFLTADNTGPKHMQVNITRAQFEKLIDPIVDKTMIPVKKALSDADLKKESIDEILLVGGSTRIPLVRQSVEKFFGKEASSAVNPDEVVAMGAAVQGGVFTGEVKDILLLDVTPLSLGLETMGGVMTRLIERNTTIPCNKAQTFTTAENSQTAVDVKVLQGEREFAQDNKSLGTFKLDGILPAPRGVPQIEVTFDIDANGIVSVSAKDKATGKEQNITITGSGTLSEHEVDQMVSDAERHREEDKSKREEVETRNSLESFIYQSEKLMSEHEETLPENIRIRLTSAVEAGKRAETYDDVKSSLEEITEALQTAGSALYENTTDSQQADFETEPTPPSDDVIDAEFEEQ
jgi:molecular chaperone DnaK